MGTSPNDVVAWVQVGGQMVQVFAGAWTTLRGAFKSAGTPDEVLAEIDGRHEDYQRRIPEAKRRAADA